MRPFQEIANPLPVALLGVPCQSERFLAGRKIRIRPLFCRLLMFFHKGLIIGLHDLLHDKLLKALPVSVEVVQDAIEVGPALLVWDIVDVC